MTRAAGWHIVGGRARYWDGLQWVGGDFDPATLSPEMLGQGRPRVARSTPATAMPPVTPLAGATAPAPADVWSSAPAPAAASAPAPAPASGGGTPPPPRTSQATPARPPQASRKAPTGTPATPKSSAGKVVMAIFSVIVALKFFEGMF